MASTYQSTTRSQHPVGQHYAAGGQDGALYAGARGVEILLRVAFSLLPIVAGLDKFFHYLTDWNKYLSPGVTDVVPLTASEFMMVVGAIEIVAGVLVAFWPRVFGYVVTLWLLGIAANLIVLGDYYDVALRDVALAAGAFALARLSQVMHQHRHVCQVVPADTRGRVTTYAEPPTR